MSDEPIYRRILGTRFDELPDSLRDLHNVKTEVNVQGEFKIERGRGWIKNAIAALGKLPSSGENIPLDLKIVLANERETWNRRFGLQLMKTVQWQAGDLMIEAGGPVRFGFRLVTSSSSLELRLEKTWFCLIRLPRFLQPRIRAIETGTATGVDVDVEFSLPLLGRVISYSGHVRAVTT
jgi:hypothetical protein